MSEQKELRLNRLPAITWYWLKMNEAAVDASGFSGSAAYETEIPSGVTVSQNTEDVLSHVATGAGKAFSELVMQTADGVCELKVTDEQKIADPIRVKAAFADGEQHINAINLFLGKNSELTVIMDFTAAEGAKGTSAVQTKAELAEGALLRVVQIVRVGEEYNFINDLGTVNADNARVELTQLVLSGSHVYQGYQVDLNGYKSTLQNDLAYRVSGNSQLDINDFANHIGKKTECEINVNGVLRENAKKILRATIDLKKGAKGAVGNEKEDVLLMDDGVRNQTIPLILCSEEDVVGNHGATIGRLDEDLMFYLASRGLNREEIYEMMAKARIDATVKLIPDEQTRNEISSYLGGGNEDDAE